MSTLLYTCITRFHRRVRQPELMLIRMYVRLVWKQFDDNAYKTCVAVFDVHKERYFFTARNTFTNDNLFKTKMLQFGIYVVQTTRLKRQTSALIDVILNYSNYVDLAFDLGTTCYLLLTNSHTGSLLNLHSVNAKLLGSCHLKLQLDEANCLSNRKVYSQIHRQCVYYFTNTCHSIEKQIDTNKLQICLIYSPPYIKQYLEFRFGCKRVTQIWSILAAFELV